MNIIVLVNLNRLKRLGDYLRFIDIVNGLEALGKAYKEFEKVMKILRSLPRKWEAKITTIQEAKDLIKLPLKELIRRSIEKENVFDFLAGLNEDLDEVKGRVLVNKIVSSLNEDFSEVKREESQRKVMLGEEKDSINNPMEGSTLTSKGGKNGYHGDYIIGRVL
ncbi:hypothetical protein CK203_033781 [Vitis vinifera]|uniref:Uncharacterized protein n=1 Tax=Vitis vinifera TaxID=29760 RepID=A0A438IQA8_VITVI|nr:hypothetical protein CK203_033781 [Vitis vinifera]